MYEDARKRQNEPSSINSSAKNKIQGNKKSKSTNTKIKKHYHWHTYYEIISWRKTPEAFENN